MASMSNEPTDSDDRVRIEPSHKRVRIHFGGRCIADCADAL